MLIWVPSLAPIASDGINKRRHPEVPRFHQRDEGSRAGRKRAKAASAETLWLESCLVPLAKPSVD